MIKKLLAIRLSALGDTCMTLPVIDSFCRAYPDLFLGFWGIDPHKGMDAVRLVEKVVKEYGMVIADEAQHVSSVTFENGTVPETMRFASAALRLME